MSDANDLVERLRELDAAATPGPWAYRPDDMDDWGIVKSPRQPVEGIEGGWRCCLAQFRHPEALDEEVLNAHRRAKTDPWQGNAELVTFLRNAVPDILGMADEITRLHAHCKAMAKALEAWDKWEGELLLDPRPWGYASGFQVTDGRYDHYVELQVGRAQALESYRKETPDV